MRFQIVEVGAVSVRELVDGVAGPVGEVLAVSGRLDRLAAGAIDLEAAQLPSGAEGLVAELERGLARPADDDVEELSAGLSDAARSLLYALAVDDHPPEEGAAEQTVEDTNRWLRRQLERARQRALTETLRSGGADAASVLREKQTADGAHAGDHEDPPSLGRSH